ANALHDKFKGDDPRAANVTAPIRVSSAPPGARAWIDGSNPLVATKTPGVLEAPVAKKKVLVRMAKAGYARNQHECKTDEPIDLELQLQRGPAWGVALEGQITGAIAAAEDRGIAVCRDGRVYALSAEDSSVFWMRPPAGTDSVDSLGEPTAAGVAQGVVVVGGRSGLLVGLDAIAGQEKWRVKGDPIVHPPLGVEIDGKERIVVCRGTTLAVIDAEQGKIEREITLPAAAAAQPAARAGKAIAVLVDGRAVLVDLAAGKIAWNVDAKVDPVGAPVLATELGFVLMASREGAVVALSMADGASRYRRTADLGALEAGLAVDDRAIYVSTARGRLLALDAGDGRTLWDQIQPAVPAAPPRRFGSSVYVPLRTGEVVELNPSDGKKRGSIQVEGIPSATPTLCGQKMLLGAGFSVYALEKAED
ncbi:MAG: PQQ-binding-like beta-propeller repeat protein, partial [Planctomycetota bacterium]